MPPSAGTARDTADQTAVRIAVVIHGFLPLVGGAETVFALGAERVSRIGPTVVFSSSLSLDPSRRVCLEASEKLVQIEESVVRTKYLPSATLLRERFILPGRLFFELLRFRPTILWTNHPSASSVVAAVIAKLTNSKWVATYQADLEPDRIIRRLFTRVECRILRGAHTVQVLTNHSRELLTSRGVCKERIAVIPPFTWKSRLAEVAPILREGDLLRPGREHPFLFVGALDPAHEYKHPEDLIVAIGKLRKRGESACAVVAGGGEDLARLTRLANDLGVSDIVEFTGWVQDSRLRELYDHACALVVPSRGNSEGFSIVMLEALSHGCPVVASSDVAGAPRFLDSGGVIGFQAGDTNQLSNVLARLIHDGVLRSELQKQACSHDLRAENEQNLLSLVRVIVSPQRSSE
jgi:glycosyltransferase involved in cell wall biosynthesis